ncbi:ATP-grasp domain-containing protein [Clostridium sp. OS1-26]|uniref:ATP-grasp domain-containing protein n=1 Tax=Clostridium sp. OS1-26 TaxID=3070681 RepID=UPI0027E04071|nr:ATP-grasp domain-containing protein [Clostridium sp. OS1-26]WML35484.1 ATP-grasp domain-containing protein [Clostridium sp. OS1-26]
MKLLITSIGKRVQLIKYLKRNCTIVGVDSGDNAPAANFVNKFYKIPRFTDERYVDTILSICKEEAIDLLIPLHEYEFDILCKSRSKFKSVETTLLLSNKKIIDVCQNKLNTYNFFMENDIGSPESYSKETIINILKAANLKHEENENIIKDFLEREFNLVFPLIVKPINGMGSSGVFKVNSVKELEFFIDYVKRPIIQEYIEGPEYTIDVLCDLTGKPISIVPRERLEIRSGEVSKTRTVLHKEIIKETYRVIECLMKLVDASEEAAVMGPYTIQCKVTEDNRIKFIEINPRFGGGVPLTFEAEVDYGKYFNMMIKGENIEPIIGQFEEMTMLRYDDAVFIR